MRLERTVEFAKAVALSRDSSAMLFRLRTRVGRSEEREGRNRRDEKHAHRATFAPFACPRVRIAGSGHQLSCYVSESWNSIQRAGLQKGY